ncbi:MAG: hypothetical protein IJT44_00375 [Clostridia bacterium]|nr:hypothetical protein [Clostridia bacterium]
MKNTPFVRGLSLLLVFVLLFAVSGCGTNDGEDTSETSQTEPAIDPAQIRYNDLRLPYSRSDSLDPFLAKSTLNRQLTPLLYDSLFVQDENFEARPLLAKEYSTDGLALRVSVNSDVHFTDGTVMTTADVLYSFGLAKESDAFKARLDNFDQATVTSSNLLLFTLSSPDPYAVACLDFPIVKIGTSSEDRKKAAEEARADSDEEVVKTTDQVLPTGSGRYTLKYEENENDPILVAFNDRYRGFFPAMTTIHLVNMNDASALFYSLEIGNISFAFDDLSSGKYTRVNASISEYPMNNLVYMGINQDDPALARSDVRQALSAAVDRENVLNIAFQGHATVTNTPFNPMWTQAANYEASHAKGQPDALKLLESCGFDQVNSYGIRNNGSVSLSFNMVVNADNDFKKMAAQQIARKLAALDIKINVEALPEDEFLDAVALGKFDLYIGEICLTPNMHLDAFFGGYGAVAHGIWNSSAGDAYYRFLSGEISFDAFMEAFTQDAPFVPLCYRKGIVACVKELEDAQNAFVGDLFADIEQWHF